MTKQRMRALRQFRLLPRVQLSHHVRRVQHGIDAEIITTAVRRATVARDTHPRETAMRRHHSKTRRFSDYRRVGTYAAFHERARPGAFELFVHDGADDYFTSQAPLRRAQGGGTHRGHARFHVAGAASIDTTVAFFRLKGRMRHSVNSDYVDVPVEQKRFVSRTGRPRARDHVGPTGERFLQVDMQSPIAQRRCQMLRYGPFTGGARN
jgi:hypothetical protein